MDFVLTSVYLSHTNVKLLAIEQFSFYLDMKFRVRVPYSYFKIVQIENCIYLIWRSDCVAHGEVYSIQHYVIKFVSD